MTSQVTKLFFVKPGVDEGQVSTGILQVLRHREILEFICQLTSLGLFIHSYTHSCSLELPYPHSLTEPPPTH
jgi:hypothetical protein